MAVSKISSIDFYTVRRVLTSNKISENEKNNFLKANRVQISQIMDVPLTEKEFKCIINRRPLIKFRPIRNSFTKAGDKILLAKTLDIKPNEVNSYIERVTEDLKDVDKLSFLPPDKVDSIKTYIYRHGSKDQVVNFLDYELTKSEDKIKSIYRNMEYHTGGVADYFIRPIHRMDNKTFIKLYNVVDKHLEMSKRDGLITEEENQKIAKWALIKLYYIRHNNKLINAIKTYKTLSQN